MSDFLHHILAFDADSPLLFTQFYFWAFFALVFAVFALIMEAVPDRLGNKKLHLRNIYLFFVSWFFYYKTSGLFLLILAFITLSDWLIAGRIKSAITHQKIPIAKLWLTLSVVIDLSLLFYFKYAYFFTNVIMIS